MNQLTLLESTTKTPIEVLLQIEDDNTVTAKRVYEFLEFNPAHYSRWCKSNIDENEYAEENIDYRAFTINGEWGGQSTTDYKLSVPFAKKLCMKSGGIRGEEAREYFVKVEEAHKNIAMNLSSLSPQMQMFKHMFDAVASQEIKQAEMQKQLTAVIEKTESAEATIANIKDIVKAESDNWREWAKTTFNKAVDNSPFKDYQFLRNESYETLELRTGCNLRIRLKNKRRRLYDAGATKTQIDKITRIDIIEEDKKLKEIYTAIIKEYAIKYSA